MSRPACAYLLEPTHFYSHPVSLLPALNSLTCRSTSTARKPGFLMGSLSVRNLSFPPICCHSLRCTHLPCAISFHFTARMPSWLRLQSKLRATVWSLFSYLETGFPPPALPLSPLLPFLLFFLKLKSLSFNGMQDDWGWASAHRKLMEGCVSGWWRQQKTVQCRTFRTLLVLLPHLSPSSPDLFPPS